MSVTGVPSDLSVERLLKAVKKLSPVDLERFAREFGEWKEGEADEAALLARIEANSRLPEAEYQRVEELRRKGQAEGLSLGEDAELQALWVRVEEMSAARLEALVQLARRRGASVQALMDELHLAGDLDAA